MKSSEIHFPESLYPLWEVSSQHETVQVDILFQFDVVVVF